MRILWFTWKDLKHPEKGGAEVVTAEITKRLVQAKHQVKIITAGGYKGFLKKDTQNGAEVIRVGNKFTVYWRAYHHYRKNLRNWPDIVIEEVNTIPFFSKFYTKSGGKHFLFFHQLAREIWFYQMIFPLSLVGYLLEPMYLWLLRKSKVITISNSTKQDLMKYGFKGENIKIISEGIQLESLKELPNRKEIKYSKPTILSLGAIRPMKRTLEIVKAFEHLKSAVPEAKLIVAGDKQGKYADKVIDYIAKSKYKDSIKVLGRVSTEKKMELMQKSHLIAVTSIKEGWGLIVTEANSQGTPAVVYDVDGLRDSVQNGKTGLIAEENNPQSLAQSMIYLLQNKSLYDRLRVNAWKWSKEITFEKCYDGFKKSVM